MLVVKAARTVPSTCVSSQYQNLWTMLFVTELQSRGGVLLGMFGGGVPPAFPNPDPISDQNVQNLFPFSDKNGSKTIPFGAAHTYIPDIEEYPLSPPPPEGGFNALCEQKQVLGTQIIFKILQIYRPCLAFTHTTSA